MTYLEDMIPIFYLWCYKSNLWYYRKTMQILENIKSISYWCELKTVISLAK